MHRVVGGRVTDGAVTAAVPRDRRVKSHPSRLPSGTTRPSVAPSLFPRHSVPVLAPLLPRQPTAVLASKLVWHSVAIRLVRLLNATGRTVAPMSM